MFAASKSGSVDAKDPQFNYVTMLLHGNGTNGAQNNTFVDSSTNNFTITRNGNTTQGTFTPYGSNWSNYFSGSSDYLQLASNSALNMNTYCSFEAWVCYSSLGTSTLIAGRDSSYWLGYNFTGIGGTANKFVFGISNGSSWQGVSSSTTPSVGVWYHVVGVKDNTTLRIYINGTQENTASFSGTAVTSATVFGIGANQNTQNMSGYVSNVRLVLGASSTILPYTSSFTPSTIPLTAISGTSLLTCQSNRFIDNSTNAFALTANGSPSVQRFSPFSPTTAYSTSVIGGSGYFDGSGDYLSIPDNAAFDLGSGDFTIECWAYTTAWASSYNVLLSQWNASTAYIFRITSGLIGLYANIVTTQNYTASVTNTLNTWDHYAVTRSGTTLTFWKNGVSVGTSTIIGTINNSSDNVTIGIIGDLNSTTTHTGYISNMRLVKGTAVYTSNFTPSTTPLTAITNTSLLLSNTNAGILDNAMMNDLETVGNAQISTSVKKYGTGSMYFDGSGDWLQAPNNAIYNLGGGDFTIEFWLYVAVNPVAGAGLVTKASNAGNTGYTIFYYPTGYVGFGIGSGGLSVQSSASSISTTTWTHVAITRSGTSGKFFINGTQSGSTGTINNFTDSSTVLAIGALDTSTGWNGNYPFNGYIDDLRITKGYARYTANFTAPTAAFADKG